MYIFKNNFSCGGFKPYIENDDTARGYISEINSLCDKYKCERMGDLSFSDFKLFDETGNRDKFEKLYFERRKRLLAFVLKLWIDNDEESVSYIEDTLWEICGEYSWALPAHLAGYMSDDVSPYAVDLFACETACAAAEAISLVGGRLHKIVVKRCVDEIFKRVIEPFETGDAEKYRLGWMNAYTNWAAVCGGAIGMTAIYVVEDEKRAAAITDKCKAIANHFIASCTNDGICLEGIDYWAYAMDFYFSFNDLLEKRMGKSVIDDYEKLKKISKFPSEVCVDEHITVPFSDAKPDCVQLSIGTFALINKIFDAPVPDRYAFKRLFDNTARFCSSVRSIALFDSTLFGKGIKKENAFFPYARWAKLFSGESILFAKGGNNDEPHNHNDIGCFSFIRGEKTIISDLGAPDYDRDYFSEKRYESFNASSRGHSVPIVNGFLQSDGAEYTDDGFEKQADGVQIIMYNAYPKAAGLSFLKRSLKLCGGLVICDSFKFTGEKNRVCERLITRYGAEKTGNTALITSGDEVICKIYADKDCTLKISREKINIKINSIITVIDFIFENASDEFEVSIVLE